MTIVNHSNYPFRSSMIFEHHTKASLTVPGQTLSLKQILEKYVRGEHVEVFTPVFTDEDIPADLERMTEIDRLELARDIKEKIEVVQKASAKQQKAAEMPIPVAKPNVEADVE